MLPKLPPLWVIVNDDYFYMFRGSVSRLKIRGFGENFQNLKPVFPKSLK